MKKSLIALAVAGALTAPMVAQADATLYGSFRIGLMAADNQDLDLRDESTRIGIKGTVDLGMEDTKGVFHWEEQVSTADGGRLWAGEVQSSGSSFWNTRLSYAGLTGSWGTALAGRQYHPHYLWINLTTDVLNTATSDAGEWAHLGNNSHKRQDNTIAYLSPNMNGFQAAAGFVVAGTADDSADDVDGYNIAAKYNAGGLYLAASYGDVDVLNRETLGLAAKYKMDALTVAARYEEQENSGVDSEVVEVAGIYSIGATNLKLRYSNKEVGSADGDQWAAEVEQRLGKKGRVYLGYFAFDNDAEAMNPAKYVDRLALGYRIDF